jgi:hypothetical protein
MLAEFSLGFGVREAGKDWDTMEVTAPGFRTDIF